MRVCGIPLGVLCQRKIGWVLGVNPNIDPYFSDVVSLWHSDNADDVILTADWNGSGYLVPAALDGTSAAVFSHLGINQFCGGGGATINAAFLTTNWTLEFFVKVESHPTIQTLYCKGADNGASDGYTETSIDILADGKIRYATYPSGTLASIQSITSADPVEYGKRLHIAVVQLGTVASIFVGGVLFATGAIWRPTSPFWPHRLGCHCYPPTRQQSGASFDEFRLTKNIARYTANFTQPNKQFPDS